MLLQLAQIKTSLNEGSEPALQKAMAILRLKDTQVKNLKMSRVSVDARHKDRISFVSNVVLEVEDALGEKLLKCALPNLTMLKPQDQPIAHCGLTALTHRPVVIGFGPAGMFAALFLAQKGYRPIVLERGACMEQRVEAVEGYWKGKKLYKDANVQFGEGGAGTFSDGKLTTRINDSLCSYILSEMVRHGAPEDILIKAKPHVGTDQLRQVVKNIRQEIISLGGEVRFLSKVSGFKVKTGRLEGLLCNGEAVAAEAVIAAVGHSARDTFEALCGSGAILQPKPFSVGTRIEHLQSDINKSLYGDMAGHSNLPVGEYQLSHREDGRAAYTFCMCPGGMVVAAASEEGQSVTNGMSYRARNLKNANSAYVISVDSADYGEDWRDAVNFQRRLEAAAYSAGGADGKAPCAKVGDLIKGASSCGFGAVEPSYPLGVKETDITAIFPRHIAQFALNSLPMLGKRLYGFDSSNAVLTGVETRTSSPVRILRGKDYTAENIKGLYPCGEGAGYAGGITSAAIDGLRCATALIERYSKPR